VVLAGIGGVIGAGLGWGATQVLEPTTGWTTAFDPELALRAVAVAAVVGTVFGIWPARRASLLDPIQALRHE
jgi:putative ABC transport system permease protein